MRSPFFRIFVVAFLVDCALMVGFQAVPFFIIDRLGGQDQMVGTISGVQSALYAFVCLLSAPFIVRAKNGLVLGAIGTLFYGTLFGLSCLSTTPLSFTMVSVLAMGGLAFIWPAMQSWLGHERDVKIRARRLTQFNIAWSAGLAVGPLIGGPLFDLQFRLPFLAVFVLCIGAAAILITVPHEKTLALRSDPDSEAWVIHNRDSERFLYCVWAANLVGWAMVGVSRSVLQKRVDDLVQAGEMMLLGSPLDSSDVATQGAWLAFAFNGTRAVVFIFMGYSTRWHHKISWLLVPQILAAAAFVVLGYTNDLAIMVICCAFAGLNNAVSMFSALMYSLANPALKHRRAAINEGIVGIGSCIGAMGFGFLAGWYGTTWPFLMTPYFVAVAVIVQLFLLRIGRSHVKRVDISAARGEP